MKIAYIFAYFGDGGAEAHALILAKKARESGNEAVFIIDKLTATAQKRLEENDFEFLYLPMESSYNPVKMIKSIHSLKKTIKEKKIDIIHAHMLREQMITNYAKLFGCKVILVRTFHRFDQFNRQMKPFMPLFRKYTDAFIAISEEMNTYMQNNGLKDNVHLILNGVEKVDAPSHELAIGFIGRLTHEKGILSFIEQNTLILNETKLVVAGDGPDYEEIAKMVERDCLKVELMGNVANRAEFFKKISVLVLPSETEVMPMVVLEAYSCGVPVVAFNLESLKNIVKPENGQLVEFPNYQEMAKEAVDMLSNINNYSKANILAFDRSYSDAIMWQKTFELYTALSKH